MKAIWKKLYAGLKVGLHLGGAIDPRIAMIDSAIEGVEGKIKEGGTKTEVVVGVTDALLNADLSQMSPERRQRFQNARTHYINTYVAVRNAQSEFELATAELKLALDAPEPEPAAPASELQSPAEPAPAIPVTLGVPTPAVS